MCLIFFILCILYFSVIEVVFFCIVKKIEVDYSIWCREGDKEKMISNYGVDFIIFFKFKFDFFNDCKIFWGFVLSKNCLIK